MRHVYFLFDAVADLKLKGYAAPAEI